MKPEHDETAFSMLQPNEPLAFLGVEQAESTNDSDSVGLNGRSLRRFWRRNSILIGVIAVTIAGITAVFVARKPMQFEGEFQLLVEPVTSVATSADSSLQPSNTSLSLSEGLDYPTLIQVLKSPSVLSGIVKQVQTRYQGISEAELRHHLTVERVNDDLAEQAQQTKLIRVSYEAEDLAQIIFVLKQLANGYLRYSREDRESRVGNGVAFIEERLPGLRQRVNTLEGQLQTLQQQYRVSDLDSEGAELAKQARAIEAQRLEAQKDLRTQKSLYANLEKQLGLAPNAAIAASSLSEDPRYQALLTQVKQIEAQIASESARFTEENPVIQDLRAQQRNLKSLLNQETTALVGKEGSGSPLPKFQNSIQKALSQRLIDTLNEIQILEIRNQAATQAAIEIDKKLREFPAIKRKYNEIQRQLDTETATLNQLLSDRETLRVEAAQQDVPWRLVSDPQIRRDQQGRPISPGHRRIQTIAFGVLAGLLLGVGAALLKDRQQNIFHSSEDLQDTTRLPLLGTIPANKTPSLSSSKQSSYGLEDNLVDTLEQNPALARAAEVLYTNLRFLFPHGPLRSLVISSVASRDGKTTIALSLAQAAASMGQRVLLVDANMALPQIHHGLGLPNFEGLSDILRKDLDPQQLIQRSPYHQNLFVLTAGPTSSSAQKLLASNQMQYLMGQLQNLFDLVIYDAVHLRGYSNPSFLSMHASGLLLVVGIAKTPRSWVMRTLRSLRAAHIPVLGVVANFCKGMETETLDNYHEMDIPPVQAADELEIFRVGSPGPKILPSDQDLAS